MCTAQARQAGARGGGAHLLGLLFAVGVLVGMPLDAQLAKGLLDRTVVGGARHAQDLVVVFLFPKGAATAPNPHGSARPVPHSCGAATVEVLLVSYLNTLGALLFWGTFG